MSCGTDIPVNQIIQNESTSIYKIKKDSDQNYLIDTIEVDSQKWNKIIQFLKTNRSSWEPTPASFAPDFSISQETFKLLGWEKR